jgi:hypothetical protein
MVKSQPTPQEVGCLFYPKGALHFFKRSKESKSDDERRD